MSRNQSGSLGERFAAEVLSRDGFQILERNFRSRYGEIDLIAQKGEILAFVEVKTRDQNGLSAPGAAVDARKQKKIIKTAYTYLSGHPNDLMPRFDVFEVVTAAHEGFVVKSYEHLKGAFVLDASNWND